MTATDQPVNPDIDALREKYRQERDKRVRDDHEDQYLEVSGQFVQYYETDPWTPPVARDPISDAFDLVILGGGFAGLVAGGRAREQGIESVRIIEMGGDFGGTWYWNRYPGVQCDIESYCYLPLLDEVNYVPKEKYSYGTEIYEHCQRIARHYRLYESALFQTQVTSLRWDESVKCWRIRTNRDDNVSARFLIMCTGSYNRPKLPGIPGITSFSGKTFHTSRWDYGYTGGDTNGGLHKLADKRVAVIGTGATGIQAVPFLGEYCQHLYVIQRTPSVVDQRGNRPTDPEWANSLKPGWARERRANFNAVMQSGTWNEDYVSDGWTVIPRRLRTRVTAEMPLEEITEVREVEDYRWMQELRDRVDKMVMDKDTAEKLKGWYRWNCKRPTFNDEYLSTFNRSNVTLVDVSSTKGVQRITEKGFVANDTEYEVDCIIFASGFEITTSMDRRLGIDTFEGRDGRSLYDHWKDGFRTFHGFSVHAFPNLFWTGFTQVGLSANITSMFDDQARHIAWIIGEALRRGLRTVEPTAEAEAEWVKTIRENSFDMQAFLDACTPGYYNNEGGPAHRKHIGDPYGPGIDAFNTLLQQWRDKGDLQGLVLDR